MLKKIIQVVAAIIENDKREILCALRSPEMSMPDLWEFPGGKVGQNENIFYALEREISEELDCQIKALEFFHKNTYEYDSFIIELHTIKAKIINGEPVAREHAKLAWLKREDLHSLKWAPADLAAVRKLQKEFAPDN